MTRIIFGIVVVSTLLWIGVGFVGYEAYTKFVEFSVASSVRDLARTDSDAIVDFGSISIDVTSGKIVIEEFHHVVPGRTQLFEGEAIPIDAQNLSIKRIEIIADTTLFLTPITGLKSIEGSDVQLSTVPSEGGPALIPIRIEGFSGMGLSFADFTTRHNANVETGPVTANTRLSAEQFILRGFTITDDAFVEPMKIGTLEVHKFARGIAGEFLITGFEGADAEVTVTFAELRAKQVTAEALSSLSAVGNESLDALLRLRILIAAMGSDFHLENFATTFADGSGGTIGSIAFKNLPSQGERNRFTNFDTAGLDVTTSDGTEVRLNFLSINGLDIENIVHLFERFVKDGPETVRIVEAVRAFAIDSVKLAGLSSATPGGESISVVGFDLSGLRPSFEGNATGELFVTDLKAEAADGEVSIGYGHVTGIKVNDLAYLTIVEAAPSFAEFVDMISIESAWIEKLRTASADGIDTSIGLVELSETASYLGLLTSFRVSVRNIVQRIPNDVVDRGLRSNGIPIEINVPETIRSWLELNYKMDLGNEELTIGIDGYDTFSDTTVNLQIDMGGLRRAFEVLASGGEAREIAVADGVLTGASLSLTSRRPWPPPSSVNGRPSPRLFAIAVLRQLDLPSHLKARFLVPIQSFLANGGKVEIVATPFHPIAFREAMLFQGFPLQRVLNAVGLTVSHTAPQ